MAFPTAEILTERLTALVASHGLDVEHVKATPAGKKSQVIVRVDGDERPTSDVLEALSGEISTFFDALEASGELNFGAGYTLEVSTPGVDLPLTQPRHFRRNRGRLVTKEGVTQRLGAISADEQSVILIRAAKPGAPVGWVVERIEQLAGAVVEIEFAPAPAAEAAAAALNYEEAAEEAIRED